MKNSPVGGKNYVHWYQMDADTILERLNTSRQGLTWEEAERRLDAVGENKLPEGKRLSLLMVILHQFMSPLIYVLLIAGVVSALMKEISDAVFIFAVLVLNAAIGAFQEYKAERSAEALRDMMKIMARVRREGIETLIEAEKLVPGDIVILEAGNKVPADLRLIDAANLTADESFLTGESLAVEKRIDTLCEDEVPVPERSNMLFAGSTVISGSATGVVVETGIRTEIGKIAEVVSEQEATKAPLVIKMERFSKQVGFVAIAACAGLSAVGLSQGVPFSEVFILAVALAVSAIPEGLPIALTVALSVATHRMAKRNVIVRKLAAVEALGSCTCIATDKTGTLTVNQQTVRKVVIPGVNSFAVGGEGYSGEGLIEDDAGNPFSPGVKGAGCLQKTAEISVLCNEGSLVFKNGEWVYSGDPVDVAFLAFAYKTGVDPEAIRRQVSIVRQVPFDSDRRYAAVFYKTGQNGITVAVKGALEALLPYCHAAMTDTGLVDIDKSYVEKQALELADQGFRVMVTAFGRCKNEEEVADGVLPPLALTAVVAMIDPLRPEAIEAVNKCRQAGIRVVMITGDHPATALAIARELGLAGSQEEVVIGSELAALGDPGSEDFRKTVEKARVFARVTPIQKLQIVETLIELGHFVAVTGDGVNDAPALRKAHIGVAMGSGTDVAKDVSSLIITDDNFASIEAGVEEGRFAYDNVRKVTYLLIATGAAEIILFVLSIIAGTPIPLFAVQLLWLNLVTNGIQDVALAFEAGESGAMKRPPRDPKEGIFDRLMIQQTAIAGLAMGCIAFAVWVYLLKQGYGEFAARNLLLMLMVLLENVHVFNCRSERVSAFRVPLRNNVLLVLGVLVAQGVHIASMYIPAMQGVLHTQPIGFSEWGILLVCALLMLAVMEVFKLLKFRFGMNRG